MELEVKIVGNEILRKKAKEVEKPFSKLKNFVANMIDTMYKENGVGLAAPQAGRDLRLFVYDVSENVNPVVCINPVLSDFSEEKVVAEEGCLSIPDVYGKVERAKKVTLTAYGLDGFKFKVEAEGLEARVIQHEYDHLDGILFIDHLEENELKKLSRKINKLEKKGSKQK